MTDYGKSEIQRLADSEDLDTLVIEMKRKWLANEPHPFKPLYPWREGDACTYNYDRSEVHSPAWYCGLPRCDHPVAIVVLPNPLKPLREWTP